ncbi:hypothetical protein FSP39_005841 [Pinctada imbricata]|uniref:Reverse transcriptase domain-containing protein n=1 Tax=Pinctada imbricata TaxID=66713 RepID=A0AA88XTL2_PINIB|nr:hypothetical protein FSP39_005841 [Pinctada imbricata]
MHTFAKNALGGIQNQDASRKTNKNREGPIIRINSLPTPISPLHLKNELVGYDKVKSEFLVKGISNGFHLGCVGSPGIHKPHNHKSTSDHPEIVEEYIKKGLDTQRIAGPFLSPPLPNFKTSPLGVVPKSDPGKFRIIHDLSYPHGNSVNSLIPQEASEVKYDSIDNIVALVQKFGYGALMAKSDIQDAFRIMPVHPSDYHLLGFSWNDHFYYERCLPMGASSSCQIFECLSNALQWVMYTKYKASGLSHILDDFFFISHAGSAKCKQDLTNFLYLCSKTNIPINMSKTILPTTKITIYGIEVDSVAMECRLPVEKVVKTTHRLQEFSRKKKVQLRDLQSLIGLLNFACSVVVPGRAFLRRLIDLVIGVQSPFHWIRLTKESRADINIWLLFLSQFNGKSVFLPAKWDSSDCLHLYTDASGAIGYAAVLGTSWFAQTWPHGFDEHHIAIKELFPIVLALELWGLRLKDKKILFFTDNISVVHVINKQSSKDKVLMALIRRLVLVCLCNNILFKAKHIPGKQNTVADSLSRFNFQAAKREAPNLDENPCIVPGNLLQI